jgi:hypothetical protein
MTFCLAAQSGVHVEKFRSELLLDLQAQISLARLKEANHRRKHQPLAANFNLRVRCIELHLRPARGGGPWCRAHRGQARAVTRAYPATYDIIQCKMRL